MAFAGSLWKSAWAWASQKVPYSFAKRPNWLFDYGISFLVFIQFNCFAIIFNSISEVYFLQWQVARVEVMILSSENSSWTCGSYAWCAPSLAASCETCWVSCCLAARCDFPSSCESLILPLMIRYLERIDLDFDHVRWSFKGSRSSISQFDYSKVH